MVRIGIYGSENSHALAFSKIFNGDDPKYADLRVVAVGGEEREASERIQAECGVERVVSAPEEMLGSVDAAMITSRDGALHFPYARPFAEAGLPLFVDKPFTRDVSQAEALVSIALKSGARLMGGSSVKLVMDVLALAAVAENREENGRLIGGDLWAPVNMHNPYGDFWFYAAHLAEMCLRVFGGEPKSVRAFAAGDDLTCVVRYPGFDATLHYTEGAYSYGGTVLTAKRAETRAVDISECYALEAAQFAALARGGDMPESGESLVMPVRFMAAIERSLRSGGCEPI